MLFTNPMAQTMFISVKGQCSCCNSFQIVVMTSLTFLLLLVAWAFLNQVQYKKFHVPWKKIERNNKEPEILYTNNNNNESSRPRQKNPVSCLYFNILEFVSSSLIHLPRNVSKLFFLHECAHASFFLPLICFPCICLSLSVLLIKLNEMPQEVCSEKNFKLLCLNEILCSDKMVVLDENIFC